MNRRKVILSGLCALAAVATGCAPLSGFRPAAPVPPPLGKSNPASFDNSAGGPGGIVQTGGALPGDPSASGKFDLNGGQTVGAFQAPAPPGGQPLPEPRAVPGQPAAPGPLGPGLMMPGAPLGGNPNVRTDPTWTGGKWGLRPYEVPTDRVAELTRQFEAVLAQNRELVARITELERQGAGREQALVEALREVEAAEAEVAKARGVISAHQSEIALLQDKIRQIEREDIVLLRQVIAALEKALPPGGKMP
ncbi:MAG TPA: hypothetical protein VGE74_06720 [Gemmata sp.]